MALQVGFNSSPTGNTIPYPAMRRRGRTNGGFFDLRDQPTAVTEIGETLTSPALRWLLESIAVSGTWMSLGCELGSHVETKGNPRHYTGGYVQVITREPQWEDDEEQEYRQLAEAIADDVADVATRVDWRLVLEVGEIAWRLDASRHDPYAMWIWFWAGAPTVKRAQSSREKLLRVIGGSLLRR